MKTEWNLSPIYQGLTDPAYEQDIKLLEGAIEETGCILEQLKENKMEPCSCGAKEACNAGEMKEREKIETMLYQLEKVYTLFYKLMQYVDLSQAVDTENGDFMAQSARLQKLYAKFAPMYSTMKKLMAEVSDVDELAKESELIKSYTFLLKENKEEAKHLLSEDAEEMVSAMNMVAGSQWSQLQSFLTSTVKVDYEGKVITLSEVRNLAYSAEAEVRKKAYEAELASYEKIQDSVAFSINNIKNQVTMLCKKRGYASVLDLTLTQSRMERKTLDAMMEAIKEYAPALRKYLRKKAEMMGYQNGLPWYELFAPMGKTDRTFTVEEAKDYLVTCFDSFSGDLSGMIKDAFEQEWIDFYPRKGKRGGAFCSGVSFLKQSRILTNFDGSFNAVGTLAHELGHAYHNKQIENERILNQDYPMPVAETASTFNEVHLGKYALSKAEGEERLNLLENDLKEHTQVILDIYSRYLFETAVFEQSQNKFLMAEDLNQLMINAQKEAYGEGLDPEYLNPGMWICKPHYYSEGLSFYNFPYAFGNLFALGLYGLFEKEGEAFVEKYKALLKATVTCTAEEAGKMVGIDLTDKLFWIGGMEQIAKTVDSFLAL